MQVLTIAQAATASINGVSSIGSTILAIVQSVPLTAQAAGTVTSIHVRRSYRCHDDIPIELSGDDLTGRASSRPRALAQRWYLPVNLQDTTWPTIP